MPKQRLNWVNVLFIATVHVLAIVAIYYVAAVHFSWATMGLAFLWFAFCGMSITGGYHRLFAHRSYKAAWPVRAFYLVFGAASVQNSALKWCADHRIHHQYTDKEQDPYNIRLGFWWAHIGWVLAKSPTRDDGNMMDDLVADPLIRWQDRHYMLIAGISGVALPAGIAALWGDAWGGFLVAGFLRLMLQWHATFSINSVAHWIGNQPYGTATTARDSAVTALVSLGEGYHNFHHRFQADYRNGVRWYHFDPTKWIVWSLAKVGATWDLKRTPRDAILRALQTAKADAAAGATNKGAAVDAV
jgi:stearoyl-CoA desaturase (delta-9 desaturase)